MAARAVSGRGSPARVEGPRWNRDVARRLRTLIYLTPDLCGEDEGLVSLLPLQAAKVQGVTDGQHVGLEGPHGRYSRSRARELHHAVRPRHHPLQPHLGAIRTQQRLERSSPLGAARLPLAEPLSGLRQCSGELLYLCVELLYRRVQSGNRALFLRPQPLRVGQPRYSERGLFTRYKKIAIEVSERRPPRPRSRPAAPTAPESRPRGGLSGSMSTFGTRRHVGSPASTE